MAENNTITVPEFDLDRLAKDIDGVFQDKLADSILNFDKDISQTSDEWRLELEKI